MHPLRLHSPYSAPEEPALRAEVQSRRRTGGALGQVGKGMAAFIVGIVIGASTIQVAEVVTGAEAEVSPLGSGPVQLRR